VFAVLNNQESSTHLFIFCPFAQACWGLLDLSIDQEGHFATLEQFRTQLQVPFFMEIIIIMSWCIWMQRNDFIFRGIQPTQEACWQHFKKEFALVILRANIRKQPLMSSWLEAHV